MREKDKKCPECNGTVKETFNFCPMNITGTFTPLVRIEETIVPD